MPFPPGENMGLITSYFDRDWSHFVRDFRYGLYHPRSRSFIEYVEAWQQGIWSDKNITWAPRGGGEQTPAFDLRVLAKPGDYSYPGRLNYNSEEHQVFKENTDPHISQIGIKRFIEELIRRTSKQIDEDLDFLVNYPADTEVTASSKKEMDEKGKYAVGRFKEGTGRTS